MAILLDSIIVDDSEVIIIEEVSNSDVKEGVTTTDDESVEVLTDIDDVRVSEMTDEDST